MVNYSDEVKKILKISEKEAKKYNSKFIGSEHLLLSLLITNTRIKDIFNKYKIYYKDIIKYISVSDEKINTFIYTPTLKKIIENSHIILQDKENEESNTVSLTLSLLDMHSSKAYSILLNTKVDIQKIYNEIILYLDKYDELIINRLGTNLTSLAKENKLQPVIGRDKEIQQIIQILSRKNKNNPVLIGEAGVGKTAIVEELARKIEQKNVPNNMINKQIISINISSIISGTKYRGDFEEKLNKIIQEVKKNKDIIVFIDEIHTIKGAGASEGAIDASNILKPYLARGEFNCIGATTIKEYKESIEKDKALERRFQPIIINEPNEIETTHILNKIKKEYENFHNVIIPKNILDIIPKLTKKYIRTRKEPDKSIDILDEVCSKTKTFSGINKTTIIKNELNKKQKQKINFLINKQFDLAIQVNEEIINLNNKLNITNSNNKKRITKKILNEVLEQKANTIIYELTNKKNLDKKLSNIKNNIIGQNDAIDKIISIFNLHQIKNSNNPTSILLFGMLGSGKNSIVNELSKVTKTNIITIDGINFRNEISVNKIVGSPHGYIGYNDFNTIFDEIKTFPNSFIKIKNYNYFHPNIKELISNMLQTGIIKNSKNEIINFSNNIIFFIENIKHSNNLGFIKNEEDYKDNITNNYIQNKILFKDLNKHDIKTIIRKLNNKLTEKEIEQIIKESKYNIYGASKIENLIKTYDNNILIKMI